MVPPWLVAIVKVYEGVLMTTCKHFRIFDLPATAPPTLTPPPQPVLIGTPPGKECTRHSDCSSEQLKCQPQKLLDDEPPPTAQPGVCRVPPEPLLHHLQRDADWDPPECSEPDGCSEPQLNPRVVGAAPGQDCLVHGPHYGCLARGLVHNLPLILDILHGEVPPQAPD